MATKVLMATKIPPVTKVSIATKGLMATKVPIKTKCTIAQNVTLVVLALYLIWAFLNKTQTFCLLCATVPSHFWLVYIPTLPIINHISALHCSAHRKFLSISVRFLVNSVGFFNF